jgi:hypothetical protein
MGQGSGGQDEADVAEQRDRFDLYKKGERRTGGVGQRDVQI